ncbi:helix-hairpin-helix domain-containing protein [Geomesophilobacter sediminis]|uniref:Helix-hairpin-helix domain-containing protein n=1 Tax=Geomesophilobacter sediminis TaxID=2798584 RepID=A0A8J7JKJ6_9BACT|nr:helix-hairpin-helix domain-containing protein [Geomesophilobacter sediminis]MBJ6724965.1 hypothetical protein [Geomesophilobacter sediminis]
MPQTIKELQEIKGIGRVLAKRLFDAGLDSPAKVAQAGEEGLQKIRGINPRAIATILEQAGQLAENAHEPGAAAETVRRKLTEVRDQVQGLAESTRNRLGDQLSPKCEKKLSSDLVRLVDALQRIEDRSPKKSKRSAKALDKAQRRVEGLEDASAKKVRKGLKKARRAVLKALK